MIVKKKKTAFRNLQKKYCFQAKHVYLLSSHEAKTNFERLVPVLHVSISI